MTRLLTGQLVAFGATPQDMVHESKGALVVGDDGTILWRGPQTLVPQAFAAAPRDDFGDKLLMAGFVDIHIHFPQYRMLAAAAADLLDWLSRYTFPEEARYADAAHAAAAGRRAWRSARRADRFIAFPLRLIGRGAELEKAPLSTTGLRK